MHMIGHHDEVTKLVADTIEVFPAIENEALAVRVTQNTRTMPFIEIRVQLAIEVLEELPLFLREELNEAFGPLLDLNAMQALVTGALSKAPNVESVKTSLILHVAKDEPEVPLP